MRWLLTQSTQRKGKGPQSSFWFLLSFFAPFASQIRRTQTEYDLTELHCGVGRVLSLLRQALLTMKAIPI
jgi:hypothetical protein